MAKSKEGERMKDAKVTMELVDKFDSLCEEYSYDDIDVKLLRKEIKRVIDNWC
jgi:hypothetical protein